MCWDAQAHHSEAPMLTPARMYSCALKHCLALSLELEALTNESGRHTAHDGHVLLLTGIYQRCNAAQRFQYAKPREEGYPLRSIHVQCGRCGSQNCSSMEDLPTLVFVPRCSASTAALSGTSLGDNRHKTLTGNFARASAMSILCSLPVQHTRTSAYR